MHGRMNIKFAKCTVYGLNLTHLALNLINPNYVLKYTFAAGNDTVHLGCKNK